MPFAVFRGGSGVSDEKLWKVREKCFNDVALSLDKVNLEVCQTGELRERSRLRPGPLWEHSL